MNIKGFLNQENFNINGTLMQNVIVMIYLKYKQEHNLVLKTIY